MSLKDFIDDWETWSKGKKIGSVIIGCCVFTLIFALIFGALSPDANDTYEPTANYDNNNDDTNLDFGDPFKIDANSIKVLSSSIDLTDQEIKSDKYAYFYEDGRYAEGAYVTYTAENIYVQLNMSNIKLNESSVLNYSNGSWEDPIVYNKSYLNKDIKKLLKSNDTEISLEYYDENDTYQYGFSKLESSFEDGILTLSYSNSSTSDYHTEAGSLSGASNYDIDYAIVNIKGVINGTKCDREVEFDLASKPMNVTTHF